MENGMQELLGEVKERMGGANDAEARRALEAVLVTLGERMRPVDAAAVAAELPAELGALLTQGAREPVPDLETFYERVAEREHVALAFAREHAQAVCHALSGWLDEQARAQLGIDVWAELVFPSGEDRDRSRPGYVPPRGRTLATGRPGSDHPLSETHPADSAQSGSVARADNPHGERKLSTGAPHADDLATGRPGSKHPLSDSKPRR